MPLKPKVFVAATALGVGFGGLPLYLWSMKNTSGTTTKSRSLITYPANKKTVESAFQEPTSTAKGKCQIISLSKEIGEFLEEKKKDKDIYVSFSCSNTDVKDSYIPIPSGWTGLFPQFFLSDQLSKEIGTEFNLTTEVQQEEGNLGSRMEATFSGTGLKSMVQGKWTGLDKTKIHTHLKDAVVSVEDDVSGQGRNVIYLFLPQNSQTNEISN